MALRSRRHGIFAATFVIYVLGVIGALETGHPSLMTVTTFLIAVAAWSYGPLVAVPIMLAGHAVSAVVLSRLAGPAGVLMLNPVGAVVPIATMECLLLVGLSSLRHRELRQTFVEAELRDKNAELEAALAEVRELRGLLPICAWCKSIRDVDGMWNVLEIYLHRHSRATLTHGMCPDCLDRELDELSAVKQLPGGFDSLAPRPRSNDKKRHSGGIAPGVEAATAFVGDSLLERSVHLLKGVFSVSLQREEIAAQGAFHFIKVGKAKRLVELPHLSDGIGLQILEADLVKAIGRDEFLLLEEELVDLAVLPDRRLHVVEAGSLQRSIAEQGLGRVTRRLDHRIGIPVNVDEPGLGEDLQQESNSGGVGW